MSQHLVKILRSELESARAEVEKLRRELDDLYDSRHPTHVALPRDLVDSMYTEESLQSQLAIQRHQIAEAIEAQVAVLRQPATRRGVAGSDSH